MGKSPRCLYDNSIESFLEKDKEAVFLLKDNKM